MINQLKQFKKPNLDYFSNFDHNLQKTGFIFLPKISFFRSPQILYNAECNDDFGDVSAALK